MKRDEANRRDEKEGRKVDRKKFKKRKLTARAKNEVDNNTKIVSQSDKM